MTVKQLSTQEIADMLLVREHKRRRALYRGDDLMAQHHEIEMGKLAEQLR